jgi:hypothetical protein
MRTQYSYFFATGGTCTAFGGVVTIGGCGLPSVTVVTAFAA